MKKSIQLLAEISECVFIKIDNYFPNIHPWIIEKKTIDPALIAQDWLSIKHTMWNYVGLVRTRERLHRAQRILRNLLNPFYPSLMKSILLK